MKTVISRANDDPAPAISVILPVLNEAQDIGRLLGEIMRQTSPPGGFEVFVVDGGSTDETRAIVAAFSEKWPSIRLLDNPQRLSSAGRNVGVRAANGKYVLFLDGHCSVPRDDYLVRTVAIFESTGAACLCRPQPLDRLTSGKWARAISAARHSWLGHNAASDIYGGPPAFTNPCSAGAAYARECIDRLGGYDERFDACEDVEFNHRVATAGLPAYRHPDLRVDYRPRSNLKALFRQMGRYGRGRAHLMARHPGAHPWPLILITLFLLVTLLALVVRGPEAAGLLIAISFGCWILLLVMEGLRLEGFRPGAIRIVLAFATIHAGLLLGFWRGSLEFWRFRPPKPT